MKNSILTWQSTPSQTEILIGENLLSHLDMISDERTVAILTDNRVAKLFGEKLQETLREKGIKTYLIPFSEGERFKSRETKAKIEDAMFAHQMSRDTLLIGIGGGVVTDLAGFVASTYCRGIPFISIPTTLLSMVDASIGGKTGVNLPQAKNFIGTIYQPSHIIIDLATLHFLPENEMRNGLSEIIKHGLIQDVELFFLIAENFDKWKQRDMHFLETIIEKSVLIKKTVVEQDAKEKGLRRILNFGHTIGHAIESLEDYTISHGEAIAIGMIVEGYISYKMKLIKERDFETIEHVIRSFEFSLKISSKVTTERTFEKMSVDKKALSQIPRFVLLQSIGQAAPFDGVYCTQVEESLLNEALDWMIETFKE